MCWHNYDPAAPERDVSDADADRLADLTRQRRDRDRARRAGSVHRVAEHRDEPEGVAGVIAADTVPWSGAAPGS